MGVLSRSKRDEIPAIFAQRFSLGLICISIATDELRKVSLTKYPEPTGESMAEPNNTAVLDNHFARKLTAFVSLSDSDLSVMSDLYRRRRKFAVGTDMIHQGQTDQSAFVIASGWACSYKLLRGGARQIVDFQIPGDFVGLRSVLFRTSDHNVEPVTPLRASVVTQAELLTAFSRTPRLATAVLWAASRDEAMVVEHLVNLGRRSATERMAHFLLELNMRLRLVGLADNAGFACPLSQYLLADALGLSAIHVNRVLRELREEGLVTFQKGRVVFDDYDALVRLSDFDRSYLDHDGPLLA